MLTDPGDHIAFYSDEELQGWYKTLHEADPDVITLPGIPFSYPEIARELLRRERMSDALDQ